MKVGDKMANEKNLIPLNQRSKEERTEIARKGQKASVEARKKNATFRKTLKMLLETTDRKGRTYRELSTLGLIKGAIDGKADNYKTMLALLGELDEKSTEMPSLNINIVDNTELEKTLYEEDE